MSSMEIEFEYENCLSSIVYLPMTSDSTIKSLHLSGRCQSATTKYRNRYYQYLKKLQEKNRLLHSEDKTKEEQLKQRENGFQLYVNGAHNISSRRPSSVSEKRIIRRCNQLRTSPTPIISNHRSQWLSTNQIQIKTDEGSIITDIHRQYPSRNNQITYRLNVDESWMPNWYSQMQSPMISSLSLEDIPVKSQQLTYRLPNIGG